jgi:hypothetical protein
MSKFKHKKETINAIPKILVARFQEIAFLKKLIEPKHATSKFPIVSISFISSAMNY